MTTYQILVGAMKEATKEGQGIISHALTHIKWAGIDCNKAVDVLQHHAHGGFVYFEDKSRFYNFRQEVKRVLFEEGPVWSGVLGEWFSQEDFAEFLLRLPAEKSEVVEISTAIRQGLIAKFGSHPERALPIGLTEAGEEERSQVRHLKARVQAEWASTKEKEELGMLVSRRMARNEKLRPFGC